MLPAIADRTNIEVNGRTYPLIEAGEGPLVVCFHGFPDNYETFQHQLEPFVKAGYRVVCPAMPGYAPESHRNDGSNNPVYVSDECIAIVETLLKSSGQQQCHLIGHDWGGGIAYMVAVKRPELLKSLAVLSLPFNMHLLRVILRCPSYAINAWYIAFFQLKGLADMVVRRNNFAFLDILFRQWSPTWKKEQYDEYLDSIKETFKAPGVLPAALSYYRNCVFGLNRVSFQWRRIFQSNINVPSLVLRGEKDMCIPEVSYEQMSPKCFRKGVTHEVLPNLGHFMQLQSPQVITDRLLQWFKLND